MDQSNSGNQQNEGNRDLSSGAGSSGGSTPPPQSSYPPSQPSSSPSSSSSYGSDQGQGQGQGQSSFGSSQGGSSYSQPTQPSYTPPPGQQGSGYGGGYSQGGQQGNQYGQSGQSGQGGQYPSQNQYGQQGQQGQYGQGGQQQYPPQNQYGGPPPTNQYGQQGYSQYNVQTKKSNPMMLPLIGLLALLLIGGGILTYFLLQPKSNNNTGVVTSPTQAGRTAVSNATTGPGETAVANPTSGGPSGNTGDNASLLKSAAENMRNLRSYTLDADIDSAGQQVVMKADIFTDNSKSRMSVSTQGIDVQVITIGDQAYLSTDGGATYEEAPAASAGQMTSSVQQLSNMWDSLTSAEIDRVQDQLRDGSPDTVDIDGTPTKHITGDLSALSSLGSGMGGAQDGTVDLWITTDGTNYVRRMAIDATSSGQQVKGTIDWMNFNEDFDIQAP
jgi:hypothetical protein